MKRRRGAEGPLHDLRDSIALSVNDLPVEDRSAYVQLAVFPEDAEFTARAAATLRGLQLIEAADLLRDLEPQAFLSIRGAGEGIRCRIHYARHGQAQRYHSVHSRVPNLLHVRRHFLKACH